MTLVLSQGVFDLLHVGHLRHFIYARPLGDYLAVGVTLDKYVGKGPGRPVILQEERLEMVNAMRMVSAAALCRDCIEAMEKWKPQILCKSYLATALGNKACHQGYKVCYFNMQKLLGKLKLARVDGTIIKLVAKISRVDLLIIDDFGMKALEGQQQNDFMEIIEDRHGRKATIIASQLPVSKWYDVIGNEVIADAILDRIVHSSHRFDIKGESLRKK